MFDKKQPAYDGLGKIYAEATRQIIFWTGAGLSVEAGLPTWSGLRKKLCEVAQLIAVHQDETTAKRTLALKVLAETTDDSWQAFDYLKEALGSTTFRSVIKEKLTPVRPSSIPNVYTVLWELGIRGILNLNLDGLASMASGQYFAGAKRVVEFTGKTAAGHGQSILSGGMPFIGNLHGIIEDEDSWIFAKTQLKELLDNLGYLNFISALAQTRTFVFAGISADDVSAGGLLTRLKEKGVQFGDHFWITHRNDKKTIEWAEYSGLRIIYYNSLDNTHIELIEALHSLRTYTSKDDIPPPIVPSKIRSVSTSILPPPEEIEQESPEMIRLILNDEAERLLSKGDDSGRKEYDDFCIKYAEAIYRAWSVNTGERNCEIFGYQIDKDHAHGSFGRVYRAKSSTGETVAIKVLHSDVRLEKQMLECFRRGVRSMHILSKNAIEGVVPYRHAWEIPACAVMDFIDGPNLEEAVVSRSLDHWPEIIHVALELARIIERAHLLPERVLHRDVRPANVMLKDFDSDHDNYQVVVLDFDLSWHQGAIGQSIDWSKSISGYVAPELTLQTSTGSTRSSLVDSFGIGMTMFFIASKDHPLYLQHQHSDWQRILKEKIVYRRCNEWHSLPIRYSRLIHYATRHRQVERWDMTRIRGELERLQLALEKPGSIQSAEMLAEELCCRCSLIASDYEWDIDRNEATRRSHASGAGVRITGNETNREVNLAINWLDAGEVAFKRVAKWIPKAVDQACSVLKGGGWKIELRNRWEKDAGIQASYTVSELRNHLAQAAKAANEAIKLFQFQ